MDYSVIDLTEADPRDRDFPWRPRGPLITQRASEWLTSHLAEDDEASIIVWQETRVGRKKERLVPEEGPRKAFHLVAQCGTPEEADLVTKRPHIARDRTYVFPMRRIDPMTKVCAVDGYLVYVETLNRVNACTRKPPAGLLVRTPE